MGRWYDAVAGKELDAIARMKARLAELRGLITAGYEEKLLGKVDEATWRTLSERWRTEAARLEGEIAAAQPAMTRAQFLSAVRSPFELVQTAAESYLRQSPEEKAKMLRIVCSNFTVNDGTVIVSLRIPFDSITECSTSSSLAGEGGRFSNVIEALGQWALRQAA